MDSLRIRNLLIVQGPTESPFAPDVPAVSVRLRYITPPLTFRTPVTNWKTSSEITGARNIGPTKKPHKSVSGSASSVQNFEIHERGSICPRDAIWASIRFVPQPTEAAFDMQGFVAVKHGDNNDAWSMCPRSPWMCHVPRGKVD